MKTILITGATDGIGLEAAEMLLSKGNRILLHGRNEDKLKAVQSRFSAQFGEDRVAAHLADLSDLSAVITMSTEISNRHKSLDVLINNAGVLKAPKTKTDSGLDVRFVVNTLAPILLTRNLLPLFGPKGRIINLSSAAQSPVDLDALAGKHQLSDNQAYAQSKLALTMWSFQLAEQLGANGPAIIAVNPGSLLGTKMVRDGYGLAGKDIAIGADILTRAALSEEFSEASGRYFDNDVETFANPHKDAMDPAKRVSLMKVIDEILK